MHISLQEISQHLEGQLLGDGDLKIGKFCAIDDIQPGCLVVAAGQEKLDIALASEAAVVVTNTTPEGQNKAVIVVQDPQFAFSSLIELFFPPKKTSRDIHPTASIGDDVYLGSNVSVGAYASIGSGSYIDADSIIHPHVSIGENVQLGKDCELYPQVVIYEDCVLGDRVTIHAGSVIGADGFGFRLQEGKQQKVRHVGIVRIDDDVEIGAATTIDRATLGETRIGMGSKIDNQVQIAHSVKLGKHNVVCAFTGIAGSTRSGDYVVFAANVGVSDHVTIGDRVILGARTGVPPNKRLMADTIYLGSPARPKDKAIEMELGMSRLPGIRKRIAKLEDKLKQLQSTMLEKG